MPTAKTLLSSLVFCSAIGVWAANPSIGFVVAKGSFQLDHSTIWSNGTLFDGSVVETKTVPSQLHLSNGSDIAVAAESRVTVFQNRVVLERGAVQLRSSNGYQVEARALRLAAAAPTTIAGVELLGNGRVAASASSGEMLISNKERVLVAQLLPGKAVTLDPDKATNPGLTRLSGCVQGVGGGLRLVDEASGVAFELHGEGVEKELGNMVEIAGTADSASAKVAGASQAINVVHLDRVGVCLAAVKTARRTGPIRAVAGAVTGLSGVVGVAGAVAVIGGVAVASTAGGLVAAGAFSSSQAEAQPATSR